MPPKHGKTSTFDGFVTHSPILSPIRVTAKPWIQESEAAALYVDQVIASATPGEVIRRRTK
jgi:hypothetical protein